MENKVINIVSAIEESRHNEYVAWRALLNSIKKFDSDDMVYETNRRHAESKKASECLEHPAAKSAMIFIGGELAAELILGRNPYAMGGKALFNGIALRKNAIDDLELEIDDLIDAKIQLSKDHNERIVELKRYGAISDMEVLYNMYKDDRQWLKDKLEPLKKAKAELVAELKVLCKLLKELVANTTSPAEKALIEARKQLARKNARSKKTEQKGRPIIMADKPMLDGFKAMYFRHITEAEPFGSIVKNINDKANECSRLERDENASDDDRHSAVEAFKKAFYDGLKKVEQHLASGGKLHLDASDAKINNMRQSQLYDVIGVKYGKTTDMVITVSHDVANSFNLFVAKYLDDDFAKANKEVEKFLELLLSVITTNGIEVAMLPNDKGDRRIVNYKFWNANNSQLKVGKAVVLSTYAYERAALAGRAGMTEAEFEQVNASGSDLLKWWSYASTPGCPLMYNGEPLTINDVLVVKSIETLRKFRNVLVYNEDGSVSLLSEKVLKRTAYDGQLFFLVPIPSQQIRGGFAFKGFGLNCANTDMTTILEMIAKREGWDLPDLIEDMDGVMRDWRQYKVICTEDCWKWAGWKFGAEKRPFTYAEYCARMNKLAEKNPCVNMLYTARIADATEEGKRQLTRQSTQQFITIVREQIAELTARSIRKIKRLTTHAGVIRKMAGLDKPEDQRTAFEHLIEVCPEMLDHPFMKRAVEDTFNRMVADAAVRPEVDGIYPYIAEDPVAFFKIVFWKKDPNEKGLGYLNGAQVNIPNEEEGKPLYIVRYPNNYLCGQLRCNHNDDIYNCVGNVMILSLDGSPLVRADGDVDGDEMCVIKDDVVVKAMKKVIDEFKPPVVSFPHDKVKKTLIIGHKERAIALAKAMVIANEYGPEVGKNSNLATKFMQKAAICYKESLTASTSDERRKAKWVMDKCLDNAIVAHVAAIIAIDLAKTGSMPEWLKEKLAGVNKYAPKAMPWNQRFCKDNKVMPWFAESWDEETQMESNSPVDCIARYVIDETKAVGYKAPTGDGFDVKTILGDSAGLNIMGSTGKLDNKKLMQLEARNYRDKKEESEDNEFKLIQTLKNPDPTAVIGGAEFARFLWRNQASLVYVLQSEGGDKLDNAQMQNAYYDFCRDLLIDFGSYCGKEAFMARSEENRHMSNIWKFVQMGFAEKNGVGTKAKTDDEMFSKKASFCLFMVKVFAYDLYKLACARKGITDIWQKPTVSTATDSTDGGVYAGEEVVTYDFSDPSQVCDEI